MLGETHLIALPDDAEPHEVESLALSRYPAARWEDVAKGEPGLLRLSRHSSLRGPYLVDAAACEVLGVGPRPVLYEIDTLRERMGPPLAGATDHDGIARAFPDGQPHREEGRMIWFALALARRLHGVVRVQGSGAVLEPDPIRATDLHVHTDVWLEPEAALAVVQSVVPTARLALGENTWSGPATPITEMTPGGHAKSAEERARIAEFSAAFDERALSMPVVRDAYGLAADLGEIGELHVLIGGDPHPPQVLAGVDWSADGVITYHVAWTPTDPDQLDVEFPTEDHLAAALAVTPVIEAVAAALHRAVAGEVTDPDGFLVDGSAL